MSAQVQDVRESTVNPTRMIHLAFPDTPLVAFCGARLLGDLRPMGTEECVVCIELDKSGWGK